MTSNKLTLPFQKPAGRVELFVLPLVGLFILMGLDRYMIIGAFTLPFLLLLGLGYLAFRLPMWAVLTWAFIYAALVLVLVAFEFEETITIPELKPYIKVATFIAGGIVAAMLAGHRARLEKSYNALFDVISALPLPVIVSDMSGSIVLLNHEAGKLLESPTNELSGLSFFSTFSNPADQGRSIANYMSYFDRHDAGPNKIILQTRGKTKLRLSASLSIVGTASQHYAVTVIEKITQADPETPPESRS